MDILASDHVDQSDLVAGAELSPRLASDPPQPVGAGLDEQTFPMSARTRPAADKPGGNDPRVVDHQAIRPVQKLDQVADVLVLQRTIAAIDHQQPGVAAAYRRRLGNQPLRQIIVVVGQLGHHSIIVEELWRPRQGRGEERGRGERGEGEGRGESGHSVALTGPVACVNIGGEGGIGVEASEAPQIWYPNDRVDTVKLFNCDRKGCED